MKLRIQKLHPAASVPAYATEGAACFDLVAATVDGSVNFGSYVQPDEPLTCGTGLAFEVPEGFVMLVFSRSGHGFRNGVRLSNCVGVIDSDYRGELMVQLTQDDRHDAELLDALITFVQPGDRIAQALLLPVPHCTFEVAEQLTLTERGVGGFGSTGVAA